MRRSGEDRFRNKRVLLLRNARRSGEKHLGNGVSEHPRRSADERRRETCGRREPIQRAGNGLEAICGASQSIEYL